MEAENKKALNKKEIFICEITWGNVPLDVTWVKNSKLFQANFNNFDRYKDLYMDEQNKNPVDIK